MKRELKKRLAVEKGGERGKKKPGKGFFSPRKNARFFLGEGGGKGKRGGKRGFLATFGRGEGERPRALPPGTAGAFFGGGQKKKKKTGFCRVFGKRGRKPGAKGGGGASARGESFAVWKSGG